MAVGQSVDGYYPAVSHELCAWASKVSVGGGLGVSVDQDRESWRYIVGVKF